MIRIASYLMAYRWALPLAMGLCYFSFHLVSGESGLFALAGLEQKRVEREAVLADLQQENQALKEDIARLNADNPDLDFLEQRTRAVLGFAEEGERIIFLPQP